MTILIDKEKLIHDLIQILHDDVCAPNGHLDPYYVFKVIKEQPSAQSEPCDDPRADIYYLAEKIGIHRLYALVVELRGEPEPCEDAVSRQAAIGECNKRGAEHIGYAIAHLPSAQPEVSRIEQELHGKTPEEQCEFLYWLLLKFGLAYTDSRLAVVEWLRGEKEDG